LHASKRRTREVKKTKRREGEKGEKMGVTLPQWMQG